MSIVVEHEERRKQILHKALDVFVEEGFEDATYQKIADRCKITRTTLYLYFRNRQEIFIFSIKQFMAEMEKDILNVKENAALPYPDKIKQTLFVILGKLEKNRRLLMVILEYLLTTLPDKMPDLRVRRRTIRLRHILSTMIIDGIKAGQLKKIDVGSANDLFYSLIESAIFRLAVLKRESTAELKDAVELAVDGICL